MRQRKYVAGLVAVLWVAGCAHLPTAPERQPAPVTSPAAAVPAPSAPAPPFRSAEEDPKDGPCIKTTHGCIALNPDVDEDNIDATICEPGYTKSVRPATSYTNGVKKKKMQEAGIEAARIGDYELDHIVPLELGGHPRKPSNLMLQPWEGERHAGDAPEITRVPRRARPHRCAGLHCAGLGSMCCKVPEAKSSLPSSWRQQVEVRPIRVLDPHPHAREQLLQILARQFG